MVGPDPGDDTTAGSAPTDFTTALEKTALDKQRIGVIAPTSGSSVQPFADAVAEITAAGATAVPLTAPTRPNVPKIVDREFGRDFAAYMNRYASPPVHTLGDLAAFGDAHPADEKKFGQARLAADAAIDLSDPATAAAYQTDLAAGRTASRAYIDTLLANGGQPLDGLMSPTATFAEVGARAGYPQITVPAGYDATIRRPVAISFTGTAGDDAKLLGFAYAYERAAQIRRPPSEINPQTWHCVAPIVYIPRTCGPGEASVPDGPVVTEPVGGDVPATLTLTLGGVGGDVVSFGPFTPGVGKEYTAATTATVTSSAADALLSVADPSSTARGHLVNGSFALVAPLEINGAAVGIFTPLKSWAAPVADEQVPLTFRQVIGATEPLRTGTYAKTLTFTLSTTAP
jgi:amidase